MPVLDQLQPAGVLRFFEEISAIPRGSGHTKAISDYCVAFAKARNLPWQQDEANNVVITKEASAGYEDAPAVMIQGHLDMVCEKTAECPLDMEKEAIHLCTDGQWIWADGTTLGGDDGIAVAMALEILDRDDLPHPRLECVFTTDEEIGMLGAAAMDHSMLTGKLLINVDSEEEGVLTVSCAGGVRANVSVPVERVQTEGRLCRLAIGGLIGGHSGVEIHKGRANADILMGRLLYAMSQEMPVRLVELSGGQADNAIVTASEALVLIPEAEASRVSELVASYGRVFAREFETADPKLTVTCTMEEACQAEACTVEATCRVISALVLLPNGVQTMSMDIPGLVQTSLNLGILRLEQDCMTASFAVRSSLATEKAMLCNKLECLARLLGGDVTYYGDYPAWEYKKDSKLRELVADVYERQTGKKPSIEAIHAGLECGIFAGKIAGLDAISFGPDLFDVHTPRERMNVASAARTWALLCEVLRRAKEL